MQSSIHCDQKQSPHSVSASIGPPDSCEPGKHEIHVTQFQVICTLQPNLVTQQTTRCVWGGGCCLTLGLFVPLQWAGDVTDANVAMTTRDRFT